MRRLLLSVALSAAAAPLAAQTVVDFESLSGHAALPATYGGINWLGGGWMHYGFVQPPFTAASGAQRVYRHALVNQFSFESGPSVFHGASFAGLTNVYFELYMGDALVHTSETLRLGAAPAFLSSGYAGAISRVDVRTPSGTQWVMDDVTYGAAPTVTPEPATVALVGLGLVGIGGITVRRRRAPQG